MRLYNRNRREKRQGKFSNIIVIISILAVTVFTVAAFVLQFRGYMEISATLTGCWFAFWTVEIVALASIRNSKTKHVDSKEEKEGEDE